MKITLVLIFINLIGFILAFVLRNKKLSSNVYDSIVCLTAAMMFSIVLFDFLPHVFFDFIQYGALEMHHEHNHEHDIHSLNYSRIALFFVLLLFGYLLQLFLEQYVQSRFEKKLENGMLIFAMFLHSFSESAVLYDSHQKLNESLLTGIIFHSVPLSFVLAYTILSRTSFKMSVLWFLIFLASIPLGIVSNKFMQASPQVFQWSSIIVSGVVLHVIWHIWGSIKQKTKLSYILLGMGLLFGYGVTLFHKH